MNGFRRPDGALDRKYLRTCAAYRLLKQSRIDARRAIDILNERNVLNARQTVELWLAWPLRKLGAAKPTLNAPHTHGMGGE